MPEIINYTPLDIEKIKAFAAKNPDYDADYYLCLIPAKLVSGLFSESWYAYGKSVNGYKMAVEKYPIPNTKGSNWPISYIRKSELAKSA